MKNIFKDISEKLSIIKIKYKIIKNSLHNRCYNMKKNSNERIRLMIILIIFYFRLSEYLIGHTNNE